MDLFSNPCPHCGGLFNATDLAAHQAVCGPTVSRQQAVEFILSSGGKVFAVEAIKRSTGELRLYNGRIGVHAYVNGRGMAYDPTDKGLLTIFDMAKHGYRSVAVEGITRVKMHGVWHRVSD